MDPFKLYEDQIVFELKLRNAAIEGELSELANRLHLELLLAKDIVVVEVDVSKEFDYCRRAFEQLTKEIGGIKSRNRTPKVKSIQSKIIHLINRLNNIKAYKPESSDLVADMISEARELTKRVELLLASGDSDSEGDDSVDKKNSAGGSGAGGKNKASQVRDGGQQNIVLQCSEPRAEPVYKWRLRKFDGTDPGYAYDFLLEVEEKAKTRAVTVDRLFTESAELFEGEALLWHRDAVKRVSCWQDLRRELLIAYQGYGNDGQLREKIRATKQPDSQGIDVFLARICGMYERLERKVAEVEQLEEILRNLNPFLKEKLMMVPLQSIQELRTMARLAESGRTRMGDLSASPSTGKVKAGSAHPGNVEVSAVQDSSIRSQNNSREFSCWNCRSGDHAFRSCTAPRKKFCFRCGMVDVTTPECPRCSKSKNE
uniref:Gag-Pol polyprotein n=1 Tax=Lygus hesperus TaxID=30085 RepID=A0A0A9Z0F8_LYGHE